MSATLPFPRTASIVGNTRTLTAPFTGVQRYVSEILAALSGRIDVVGPRRPSQGISGHLWEQAVLPGLLEGRLLWSPSNTGPLRVRRQVLTVHDLVPVEHPEWVGRRFGAWYRYLQPKLIPSVRRVIAISNFTREAILAHFRVPAERVVMIHNGVERRFHPRCDAEKRAAQEHCRIPTPHYILSVGSLESRKNLRRLLLAWRAIAPRVPHEICLVLAGKRGASQVFPQLDLDPVPERVHFTGHVPDEHLPALMSGALAFAYPSIYEGFGLPPLEAMACGTPVVTSRTTAMPEVVGDAALLVDPLNEEELADALLRVVESTELRAQLRARGLQRAAQFSWERAAQETLRVLNAALDS
jgi:glycosyltransferase involved in cell wall biosynthesis